ncbi:hypothetical protein GCM10010121_025260 [Streptomyces brasiliensis]|uniref:MmyB-like transcription regulator ligand binding domain-containing protein n=1 Tax=Streptomyces brasiliensis TaxID=1954 RepID=A0A917KHB2_9ACTN|nr:hypothetical protein GCM10010121_025260 [Streptomyces brasiliensis]
MKTFRHVDVGELRMTSVSLSVNGMPECRIVVYTPDDEETARRTALLRERRERLWPPHAARWITGTTKNPAP